MVKWNYSYFEWAEEALSFINTLTEKQSCYAKITYGYGKFHIYYPEVSE